VCRIVTEHAAWMAGAKQMDGITQNMRSGEEWYKEKLGAAET